MFKSNKVILLTLIIIMSFVGYRYFLKKDGNKNDSALVAESAQNGTQTSIGKDLLVALSRLKSLTLDDSFFKDPIFKSLNDFSIPIIPQEVGRSNPFAPIGGSSGLLGGLSGDKKTSD